MRRALVGPVVTAHALAVVLGTAMASGAAAQDDKADASPASAEGVARLAEALRSSDSFKVRATAAVQLARTGDPRAAPPLVEALRADDHYAVRAAAASALGRLSTTDGVPALLNALRDSDQFVRDEAQAALDRFHTTAHVFAFREALSSDDALWRLAAVRAYGDVMRENPAVSQLVVSALGDDDANVSTAAETAVAGIAHDRAIPLLVGALSSGSSPVRAAAARLLTKRADKTAVEPLITIATSIEESEDVRKAARDALRAHRDYLDVQTRVATASDPKATDRLQQLRVVAAVGEPKAFDLVERAMVEPDANVRVTAARAAVDLGGDRAKKLLESAKARESDPRTQKQLELLLKSLH